MPRIVISLNPKDVGPIDFNYAIGTRHPKKMSHVGEVALIEGQAISSYRSTHGDYTLPVEVVWEFNLYETPLR